DQHEETRRQGRQAARGHHRRGRRARGERPKQGRRASDRWARAHRDAAPVAGGRHRDGENQALGPLRFMGDGSIKRRWPNRGGRAMLVEGRPPNTGSKETAVSTIYDTFDFGYDPSVAEEPRPRLAPQPAALPSSAMVNQTFLPPVGKQTLPNCFVWSSAYGAATFWAAQSSNTPPTTSNLQASPDYTYIKLEIANG